MQSNTYAPNGTELAAQLAANRDALRAFEGSALAGVAEALSNTVDKLLDVSERLEKSQPTEWMSHEECALYLKTTPDALYKLPVPFHKLGGKRLYSRREVDAAVRGV